MQPQNDADKYSDMVLVSEAFKKTFGSKCEIITAEVKVGGTSGVVYIPKRFNGSAVTVIIWPENKNKDNINMCGASASPKDEIKVEVNTDGK
jgi:putative transposon-encoded protein